MSGRLVILPKKSYCPWNAPNLERVLRDERQHALALEQEKKETAQAKSAVRMALLQQKQKQKQQGNVHHSPQTMALEEPPTAPRTDNPKVSANTTGTTTTTGRMVRPLFLGQLAKDADKAFYLKPSSLSSSCIDQVSSNAKEQRLLAQMDPMRDFAATSCTPPQPATTCVESSSSSLTDQRPKRKRRHEKKQNQTQPEDDNHDDNDSKTKDQPKSSSRRKRHHHSRHSSKWRKHHPHDHSSSSSTHDKFQELRKRRQEREAKERQRQKEIVPTNPSTNHHYDRNVYMDQYHPQLSRK